MPHRFSCRGTRVSLLVAPSYESQQGNPPVRHTILVQPFEYATDLGQTVRNTDSFFTSLKQDETIPANRGWSSTS